jgi:hypothetical protein
MTLSPEMSKSVCDFVRQQLLIATSKLMELYKLGDEGAAFRDTQYHFLWFTSLADTDALGATYDLMCKDGAHFNSMPIDSKAVFGRIYIAAIAPSDPKRANQVFENLIRLYTDPGEDAHIQEIISNAAKT